jgi:hypothetical protein
MPGVLSYNEKFQIINHNFLRFFERFHCKGNAFSVTYPALVFKAVRIKPFPALVDVNYAFVYVTE